MRTFISIKLPLKILILIKEIQDSLPEFYGKKTEIKNLHLTLKFLGEISSENLEKVKNKLREIDFFKFEVELNELGFFDNSNTGIVWISISNCENLQRVIDRALENLFVKERRFMGHITLARVKEVKNKKNFLESIKRINVPKLFFTVDKFYLVESKLNKEGPEYTTLEDYNLK
jgi:2'-5' RNA ligase